jgi:hypothetical protein
MNPIPAIPMLSSNGNGKVLLVFGILVTAAIIANCQQKKTT